LRQLTSLWTILSVDTRLKMSPACANLVATCFVLLVLYNAPNVRVLQNSPSYPGSLKWLARILLLSASALSFVIAVRGVKEDLRASRSVEADELIPVKNKPFRPNQDESCQDSIG